MPIPQTKPRQREKASRNLRQAAIRVIAVSAIYLLGSAGALAGNCNAPELPRPAITAPSLSDIEFYGQSFGHQEGTPMQWTAQTMYQKARDFFQQGDDEKGWKWAESAKDCGSTDAIVLLIEQSIAAGRLADVRKYLEAGVSKGIHTAKYLLAEQYDQGAMGFPKDRNQAFQWYYSAARDGNAKAMHAVAYYFVRGFNGVQSDLAAAHWYHEAMRAGNDDSKKAFQWMADNSKNPLINSDSHAN